MFDYRLATGFQLMAHGTVSFFGIFGTADWAALEDAFRASYFAI